MMAESVDCPCSNITIMQLFHELKQKFPAVPDQIVSKIIQENYHDKSACERILQLKGRIYRQSYPGALISGGQRDPPERGPLCRQCSRQSSEDTQAPPCSMPNDQPNQSQVRGTSKQKYAFSTESRESSYESARISRSEEASKISRSTSLNESCADSPKIPTNPFFCEARGKIESPEVSDSGSSSAVIFDSSEDRTFENECAIPRSQSCVVQACSESISSREVIRPRSVEGNGSKCDGILWNRTGHTGALQVYNVAVNAGLWLQPPCNSSDQPRPFTSVNLTLRPPSSEPQPPIEIQSGQSLTYRTSKYDPEKGFQSQLEIRIHPGGGGTVSACRTHISSPHLFSSSKSPSFSSQLSADHHCHNRHHFRALLEKQRERRDLLSKELQREKEKLRSMQNEVKLMQAAVAQKPSPNLLPKLKAEIVRLRAECERLTAAVDLYADNQNNLPLGETSEEFYRNIYTGQPLQREGSWSCHVCTFRNHALLLVCEECEMPRLSIGTTASDVSPRLHNVFSNNNTSMCAGAGTSTSASLITAPLQER